MNINKSLEKNRKKIIDQWFEATIKSYPPETARVLGRIKNRFDNPVGSATQESLENVFDQLFSENTLDPEKLEDALDTVVRIRAVQKFTASDAVGFVFELKDIVKNILETAPGEDFDRKVDQVALAAFNRFMKCRESIFLIKATESKRRIHKAFERAGLVTELKDEDLL
ncbi:MAG: RsbRD N-terminal domain-containing protein [Desulfobacterium sp.]|nr:RsbRD N-terminal domain-containing protein [Desulfobacterium sp.]